jgi:adenylyl-sulfate kinase
MLGQRDHPSEILDGDELRRGVCNDLSFTPSDRCENVRRAAIIAKYLALRGTTVLVAVIAPYSEDRRAARQMIGDSYLEIYVECPVETCQARDVKGLYALARSGALKGLTGIDGVYQPPLDPDLTVRTDRESVDACARMAFDLLQRKGYCE